MSTALETRYIQKSAELNAIKLCLEKENVELQRCLKRKIPPMRYSLIHRRVCDKTPAVRELVTRLTEQVNQLRRELVSLKKEIKREK